MATGNPVRTAARRLRRVRRQVRTCRRLRRGRDVRLHLGCGVKRLPGFINIDRHDSPATDYVGDITNLPIPPRSVQRIETYHVIEHIPQPAVRDTLRSWRRWLKPGGVLVIECPDFDADVRDVLAGDTERMFSIFGRQRFPGDAHHWGYSVDTLSALLRDIGFAEIRSAPASDYHAASEPCIRVEAVAPS